MRKAFRTLAAEGLVDLLLNRSVVVSELRAADIAHLFVVFAEIEALAARLAVERIADEEVNEISRYLNRMVDHHARQERGPHLKLNHKIHQRTVEIADNLVLYSVWQSLAPQIERARALPKLNPNRWTAAPFEHSKMFTTLAARDGEALAKHTRANFMNGLLYIAENVQDEEDAPSPES